MSTSRRIKKESERSTDELQAKIVLERGKKIPKIEIIDKAIQFARRNEEEFIDFLLTDQKEDIDPTTNPLDFITDSVKGAQSEDFQEYNYDDIGG